MKFRLRSPLLLLFAALPLLAQTHDTFNGHDVVANQVIFKLSATSTVNLQQLNQLSDADDLRTLSGRLGIYLLHSRSGNVNRLLALLQSLPSVVYAEPDYFVKIVNTPNDTYFPQQWSLLNLTTPGADIAATAAWNISTGSTANVVGVVDTGIDYTHPDLTANVWSAPSAFTVSLSWGQLTCPAGSHGYNAILHTCDPRDDNQHGTHVSGTIGASGNNAAGVAGVNWTTRIMGLKFLDNTGNGTSSNAIDAIEFAIQAKTALGAAANVRVLSNSWGGSGYSQSLLDEINKANSNEMLFVVAAGNSAQNNDTNPQYPAGFSAPNLISVAATTNVDSLASFSNYGATTISLGAPGVNILSTVPNSGYAYLSGTSMATPHVSGAAMLVLSACNLNTAALKSVLLSTVDPLAALSGITVTGGRLNVNKALLSCSGISGTPSGTASFVKGDTTTQGNWKGAYGGDGGVVIGDQANTPAYVSLGAAGNFSYTWAASTSDIRGMQKTASSSDRVAACWYAPSSFQLDVKFNDASVHQVALYLLDWDSQNRGERVDVLDSNTNAVLDSRSVSSFAGGQYLVWNLSGHVVLRITNSNGAVNAVVSGILFGTGGTVSSPNSAAFVKSDAGTAGTWKGVYGADGSNVIGDSGAYPAYASVTPSGNFGYTWAGSTSDVRAVQKYTSASDRIAACWYSPSTFSIDVNLTDQKSHQVALYLLDWDVWGGGRTERVDILDGSTNGVLDSRNVSGFSGGVYLVWTLGGHVVIRVTNTNSSSNAVVSGLFFGGAGASNPNTAVFVKTDNTTAGNWKGVYGLDGSNVIDDGGSYPAYVSVSPAGNLSYDWALSSTDARALQKYTSTTDRIASCWYSPSAFTIDLNFKDSNTHQLALYLLDWDNYGGGRGQTVDILDGTTSAVLDSRPVSSFTGGRYLVWNLAGHVVIRVTNTKSGLNAVMSGLFFR